MSIFSKLPGNRYEETVSALFQYFFMNSKLFRRDFLRLLSRSHGSESIFTDNETISCILEYRTSQEGSPDVGRLDMLITTDKAVIGIESKFDAALGYGQHTKYIEAVTKYASTVAKIPYFTIIVPMFKAADITNKLGEIKSKECKILEGVTWELINKILDDCLKTIREEESEEMYYLMRHFKQYIDTSIGAIPGFEENKDLFSKPFAIPAAEKFRQDFLNQIYKIMSAYTTGRQGSGGKPTNYVGTTFHPRDSDSVLDSGRFVWIGFIESPSRKPAHQGKTYLVANLVLRDGTSFIDGIKNGKFESIPEDDRNDYWYPRALKNERYLIEIDKSWNNMSGIATALKPLMDFLDEAAVPTS